jgi:hypothetical protein
MRQELNLLAFKKTLELLGDLKYCSLLKGLENGRGLLLKASGIFVL